MPDLRDQECSRADRTHGWSYEHVLAIHCDLDQAMMSANCCGSHPLREGFRRNLQKATYPFLAMRATLISSRRVNLIWHEHDLLQRLISISSLMRAQRSSLTSNGRAQCIGRLFDAYVLCWYPRRWRKVDIDLWRAHMVSHSRTLVFTVHCRQ